MGQVLLLFCAFVCRYFPDRFGFFRQYCLTFAEFFVTNMCWVNSIALPLIVEACTAFFSPTGPHAAFDEPDTFGLLLVMGDWQTVSCTISTLRLKACEDAGFAFAGLKLLNKRHMFRI